MDAFLISFGIIFLAELGDKSQLMAMAFAARYPARTILIAITAATALVHLVSVLIGAALALRSPPTRSQLSPGLRSLHSQRGRSEVTNSAMTTCGRAQQTSRSIFLTVGVAFFLAELGDKTMLATITLRDRQRPHRHLDWINPRHGRRRRTRHRRRPATRRSASERVVKIGASVTFVVFGLFLVAEGLR